MHVLLRGHCTFLRMRRSLASLLASQSSRSVDSSVTMMPPYSCALFAADAPSPCMPECTERGDAMLCLGGVLNDTLLRENIDDTRRDPRRGLIGSAGA